ncbi:PIN domain-like protein [Coniochaeta hoffmannii]|uniref:PIN domain-like protein n=1 Tax=Coniochaeta hoffmannii TaxID=91930 RepID=A0AA38VFQ8_9PEZI|nr:PIN domain-like protein [Coniochaeta hoffmannii]
MGIKGIYKEIGAGQRMSLSKLAVQHLEETGRPLRLAIDISIWQFQVQAAKGGSNPAIRTLFYRLVRLLGHSIQPLFVFDGPNKPALKRGKRSTGTGDATSKAMMKRLIRLFGFMVHDAPGEAEAECALLQQKGVVDAVLSEDVDTIMFGCGKTMRSWSAESKSGQTPTHVTVYDAEWLRRDDKGLDREGMVLVALMSGGDYIPEGIPNCGVKLACEAARAGFGTSLCRIRKSDQAAIDEWKADLLHQLRTNEKGYFRTKHKALTIPDSFPNMEVLRYYTHPVVSQQSTVERLGRDFPSKTSVDIAGLREFVRDTFDWTYRGGAVKLVRVLAPSLLVQSLLNASTEDSQGSQDLDTEKRKESALVKAISNRRIHSSTDGMPELRISYVPIDMVPLDLDAEPVEEAALFGRDGLALNSDDEFDEEVAEVEDESQAKKSRTKPYDVLGPNPVWVPEQIVQLGIPLTFEDWGESQRKKTLAKQAAAAAPKRGRKRPVKKPDMLPGSLDKWVKATKDGPAIIRPLSSAILILAAGPDESKRQKETYGAAGVTGKDEWLRSQLQGHVPTTSSNKAAGVTNSDPITLLSEDDEPAPSLPSYAKRESKESAKFAGSHGGGSGHTAHILQSDPVSGGEEFPSINDTITPKKTNKKTVYMPRLSAVGYFKKMEVELDEAERLGREGLAFAESDLLVIDMTGPDL